MSIAIIAQGGAGAITPDRIQLVQVGCKDAVLIGWRILQDGGSALNAVEATVRALEDNPQYNAGTGSCLNAEGNIEMDAGIMDGHTLAVGAVAGVERIKNPISLARLVLQSSHVLLIGHGAEQFAMEHDMTLCTREDLLTQRQYEIWQRIRAERLLQEREPEEKHGTVGAVAIDSSGMLAAATSTGGMPYKYPGRVGDSPLVGCGFYADEQAAVSCTGHGEDFIRLLLAKRAADAIAQGMLARTAAESAIALLGAKVNGTGGLILVDRLGNVGFAWNTPNMAYAYMMESLTEPMVGA